MPTLQAKFVKTKGQPIHVAGQRIVQMDRLAVTDGTVRLTFIKASTEILQGVALKVPSGKIYIPHHGSSELMYVWDTKNNLSTVEYRLSCPKGELRIWNIYKTPGSISEADAWTNNAGMVVTRIDSKRAHYQCSDGIGDFTSNDLVFKVEIFDNIVDG